MEINPYLDRLRILEQTDEVQMQREAAADGELAGCPGCPYFWSCPVPHRSENVVAAEEIDPSDVADQLPARRAYRPFDADDIGWEDDRWAPDEDGAEGSELPPAFEDVPEISEQEPEVSEREIEPPRRGLRAWLSSGRSRRAR